MRIAGELSRTPYRIVDRVYLADSLFLRVRAWRFGTPFTCGAAPDRSSPQKWVLSLHSFHMGHVGLDRILCDLSRHCRIMSIYPS